MGKKANSAVKAKLKSFGLWLAASPVTVFFPLALIVSAILRVSAVSAVSLLLLLSCAPFPFPALKDMRSSSVVRPVLALVASLASLVCEIVHLQKPQLFPDLVVYLLGLVLRDSRTKFVIYIAIDAILAFFSLASVIQIGVIARRRRRKFDESMLRFTVGLSTSSSSQEFQGKTRRHFAPTLTVPTAIVNLIFAIAIASFWPCIVTLPYLIYALACCIVLALPQKKHSRFIYFASGFGLALEVYIMVHLLMIYAYQFLEHDGLFHAVYEWLGLRFFDYFSETSGWTVCVSNVLTLLLYFTNSSNLRAFRKMTDKEYTIYLKVRKNNSFTRRFVRTHSGITRTKSEEEIAKEQEEAANHPGKAIFMRIVYPHGWKFCMLAVFLCTLIAPGIPYFILMLLVFVCTYLPPRLAAKSSRIVFVLALLFITFQYVLNLPLEAVSNFLVTYEQTLSLLSVREIGQDWLGLFYTLQFACVLMLSGFVYVCNVSRYIKKDDGDMDDFEEVIPEIDAQYLADVAAGKGIMNVGDELENKHEQKPSKIVKFLKSLAIAAGNFVLKYSYLITSVALYITSVFGANLINFIYLIFFLVFTANATFATDHWGVLVFYSQLAVSAQYLWQMDFLPDTEVTRLIGLDKATGEVWVFLLARSMVVMLSTMQLFLIRLSEKTRTEAMTNAIREAQPSAVKSGANPDETIFEEVDCDDSDDMGFSIKAGTAFPKLAKVMKITGYAISRSCLWICSIGFFLAGTLLPLSIVSLSYLFFAFVCVITIFHASNFTKHLRRLWTVIVFWQAIIIFATFAMQIDAVYDIVKEFHANYLSSAMEFHEIGFRKYEGWALLLGLLPLAALFVLSIMQFRLFKVAANRPEFMPKWLNLTIDFFKRLVFIYMPFVMFIYAAVTCLQHPTALNFIILLILLISRTNEKGIDYIAGVLFWLCVVTIVLIVFYNVSFFNFTAQILGPIGEWFGLFRNYNRADVYSAHTEMWSMLFEYILLIYFVCVERVSWRWGKNEVKDDPYLANNPRDMSLFKALDNYDDRPEDKKSGFLTFVDVLCRLPNLLINQATLVVMCIALLFRFESIMAPIYLGAMLYGIFKPRTSIMTTIKPFIAVLMVLVVFQYVCMLGLPNTVSNFSEFSPVKATYNAHHMVAPETPIDPSMFEYVTLQAEDSDTSLSSDSSVEDIVVPSSDSSAEMALVSHPWPWENWNPVLKQYLLLKLPTLMTLFIDIFLLYFLSAVAYLKADYRDIFTLLCIGVNECTFPYRPRSGGNTFRYIFVRFITPIIILLLIFIGSSKVNFVTLAFLILGIYLLFKGDFLLENYKIWKVIFRMVVVFICAQMLLQAVYVGLESLFGTDASGLNIFKVICSLFGVELIPFAQNTSSTTLILTLALFCVVVLQNSFYIRMAREYMFVREYAEHSLVEEQAKSRKYIADEFDRAIAGLEAAYEEKARRRERLQEVREARKRKMLMMPELDMDDVSSLLSGAASTVSGADAFAEDPEDEEKEKEPAKEKFKRLWGKFVVFFFKWVDIAIFRMHGEEGLLPGAHLEKDLKKLQIDHKNMLQPVGPPPEDTKKDEMSSVAEFSDILSDSDSEFSDPELEGLRQRRPHKASSGSEHSSDDDDKPGPSSPHPKKIKKKKHAEPASLTAENLEKHEKMHSESSSNSNSSDDEESSDGVPDPYNELLNYKRRSRFNLFIRGFFAFLFLHTQTICIICLIWNHVTKGTLLSLVYVFFAFGYLCLADPPLPGEGFYNMTFIYTCVVLLLRFVMEVPGVCMCHGKSTHHWYFSVDAVKMGSNSIICPQAKCNMDSGVNTAKTALPYVVGLVRNSGYFALKSFWELVVLVSIILHKYAMKTRGMWGEQMKNVFEEENERVMKRLDELEYNERLASSDEVIATADVEAKENHLGIKTGDIIHILLRSKKPGPTCIGEKDGVTGMFDIALTKPYLRPEPQPEVKKEEENESSSSESEADEFRSLMGGEDDSKKKKKEKKKEKLTVDSLMKKKGIGMLLKFYVDLVSNKSRKGRDLYFPMMILQFVILIYFALFGAQVNGTEGSLIEYISQSYIPVSYIMILLIQFIVIVIDRIIYIRRSIVGKIILQFATLIMYNVMFLWVFPSKMAMEYDYTSDWESGFCMSSTLQIAFLLMCAYWFISGVQIRDGYPHLPRMSIFMNIQNVVGKYLYRVYRAIPFLYEMRTILDWTFSHTTQDIKDYFKIAEIEGNLFERACEFDKTPKKPGTKVHVAKKACIGCCCFFLLCLVLWLPLFIVSDAFPDAQVITPVDSATLTIDIPGWLPVFSQTIIRYDSLNIPFTEDDFDKMREGRTFIPKEIESVQIIQFDSTAESIWQITSPSKQQLLAALSDPDQDMTLHMSLSLTRPSTSSSEVTFENEIDLDEETKLNLKALLETEGAASTTLTGLFPRYLRMPGSGSEEGATNPCELDGMVCPDIETTFTYHGFINSSDVTHDFWEVSQGSDALFPYTLPSFAIISTPVSSSAGMLGDLAAMGLIGIYATIILAVGDFVRDLCSGLVESIMFEDMTNPFPLIQLIRDVALARQDDDMVLEEELVDEIVQIFRSPEAVIERSRLDQGGLELKK